MSAGGCTEVTHDATLLLLRCRAAPRVGQEDPWASVKPRVALPPLLLHLSECKLVVPVFQVPYATSLLEINGASHDATEEKTQRPAKPFLPPSSKTLSSSFL
jgi:hypothetical protein